jgi:hypothetical protein
LVRLAEDSMLRRKISLALGFLGAFGSRARESELVTRVRRILTIAEPGRGPKFLRAATGAVFTGALAFSILLARSPRLVDFATPPTTVAAASFSASQAPASAMPASLTAGAKLTLAKAVVPDTRRAHPAVTPVSLHKHAAVRRRTLRAMQSEPAVEVQVWRESVRLQRPVVTLTSADSQQLYAAVPWRGGWLLFQL